MQDHPAAVTGWTCPEEIQGISVTDELIDKRGRVRLSAILNYFIRGRGPMATTGCDHGALISTRGKPSFSHDRPALRQCWAEVMSEKSRQRVSPAVRPSFIRLTLSFKTSLQISEKFP